MDENLNALSSAEATKKFKSEISKCLSLLGFISNTDKDDVWRFWKTISAAVKIAVSGRGSIIKNSKVEHKQLLPQICPEVMEESRLQELDQNAISVYVPLKSSNVGVLKYRVLKFAEQKKIADYFEEVRPVSSHEKKVQRWTNTGEADSESGGLSENTGTCVEELQPSILSLVRAGAEDNTNEGFELDAKSLHDVCPDPLNQMAPEKTICSTEANSVPFMKNVKLPKKIWPVGRPTTRSHSSKTSIFPTSNTDRSSLVPEISPSPENSSNALFKKENEKSTGSLSSHFNLQGSQENLENHTDMITIPIGNPVLQVGPEKINTETNCYSHQLQVKERPKVISIDPGRHVTDAIPAMEKHMNTAPEDGREVKMDTNIDDHSPQNTAASTSICGHQQSQSSQPRNASDIETIISALEEELKKSGSDATDVSVEGDPWPTDSSAKQTSVYSNALTATENRKGDSKGLSHGDTITIDSTGAERIVSSSVNDVHTPYLNIQADGASSLDPTTNDIDRSDQHELDEISTQAATHVTEPEQAVKLQPAPIQVAAYIDETGQPIQVDSGQLTTLINESGQPVQILHGQEIVEVEGSIDNIIWACDGEVQIMQQQQQQQQQQEEHVQNNESVAENQRFDTNELIQNLADSQPVQAHYDVVEYEVLSDKRLKRGCKRKVKSEDSEEAGKAQEPTNTEVLDRTCPICHRVLHYASSMKAHMRIHTGARPYSCGQCDRKFTTKANRDRHEATHVGLKPFKCDQCHKSFTEKRSLKIHMRSHTGERPYVCETCGQGFAQKCTLNVHKERHTDRRAHLCDLCGKAFRQKSQLEVHVKRHNRQAAYACEHCERRCYTRGDLARHMFKHTGERPYMCQLCPRAFTRKQYLIDHENQHYNRKPYRCSECGMSFHDMGSCHRHLRKHKTTKDDNEEIVGRPTGKLPVLNVDVVHKMLANAKPGQILKLEDGSDAVVKQVTSDTDGSMVYHITCLNMNSNSHSSAVSVTQFQQQQQQQQQHDLPQQTSHEVLTADTLTFSQEAAIKVENVESVFQDHASYGNTQTVKVSQTPDGSKVEDFAVVNVGNHEAENLKSQL